MGRPQQRQTDVRTPTSVCVCFEPSREDDAAHAGHSPHLGVPKQPDVCGVVRDGARNLFLDLFVIEDEVSGLGVLLAQQRRDDALPLGMLATLARVRLEDGGLELLSRDLVLLLHVAPCVNQAGHLHKARPFRVVAHHVSQQRVDAVQVGLAHLDVLRRRLGRHLFLRRCLLLVLLHLNHLVLVLLHRRLHVGAGDAAVVKVCEVLDMTENVRAVVVLLADRVAREGTGPEGTRSGKTESQGTRFEGRGPEGMGPDAL
eukprot:364195-Chlamydomonas_euryale.AAC.7